MTKKKQYKKQLPTAVPPQPRRGPDADVDGRPDAGPDASADARPDTRPDARAAAPASPSLLPVQAPEPELEQVREAIRQLVHDLDEDPGPAAAQTPTPAPAPAKGPAKAPAKASATTQAAPARAGSGKAAPGKAATTKAASAKAAPARAASAKAASARPATRPATPSQTAARTAPAARPAARTAPAARPTAPASLPAPPVERERASGRKVAGLALLVLVSAAVGGGVVAWQLGSDDPPAPSDTPAAQLPAGWPEAGASRTLTRVRSDGSLEVTHWIHTEDPLDQVDVSLPEAGEGTAVVATDVQVTADGEAASGPAEITFSRATYVFSSATLIRVTYDLDGAVQRSSSATGRGLATTTALDVSATQPRDVRVIRSAEVLSLSCAPTMATELVPCGTSDGDGEWKVQLTGSEAGGRVVAAVTVPS
ncbi:hypothetical protein EUA93_14995 [Nocardioides oleivorans]|uniref:Uncharacterized protein n=1 Tax=Nocardioides oleivorans TaxID=273676 RepID=A0A4Q2S5F9_9ACTN|nr:hypothetical protein [Nocardioides oleivorans]RYB95533.1 hypothetical protein EUA93_14995 [Nocardioides oleivorans]